jgi:hypothetical protein
MLAFKIKAVPYDRDGDRILLKITRGAIHAEVTIDGETLLTAKALAALRTELDRSAGEARDRGLEGLRLCLQPASSIPPKGWTAFQKGTWFIDI